MKRTELSNQFPMNLQFFAEDTGNETEEPGDEFEDTGEEPEDDLEDAGEEGAREADPSCCHEKTRGDRAVHAAGPEKE